MFHKDFVGENRAENGPLGNFLRIFCNEVYEKVCIADLYLSILKKLIKNSTVGRFLHSLHQWIAQHLCFFATSLQDHGKTQNSLFLVLAVHLGQALNTIDLEQSLSRF